jgi:hypothetical protein
MISFRNKCDLENFGNDYYRIRKFLIELNDINFLFGRWDWMITHTYLDVDGLPKIAVWEDNDEIFALATYDTSLGSSYFCVKDGHEYLKKEMLDYAKENFSKDGTYRALIADSDVDFHNVAAEMGFSPTTDTENDAYFPIDLAGIAYKLPEGFSITSMADNYDLCKYGQVLWKGFNHELNGEGEYKYTEEKYWEFDREMKRPNVNLDIKIAVVNPEGDFVSYCGMWQDQKSKNALVEPVATDPQYRRLGLGKAAVLEGIARCGLLGSKTAWVGSSQLFYYSIGFRPFRTSTWWENKSLS